MTKYCSHCGAEIDSMAEICPKCGVRVMFRADSSRVQRERTSDKEFTTTLLLCLFLGCLGIHRFYVGKTGTGILWMFTCGCFGIGILVDFIMICCGSFKDSKGLKIKAN